MNFRQEFIEFAVAQNVLRFGEFRTKAGRLSPYFFNAGLFNDGAALGRLAEFYARAITASGILPTCCSVRPTRESRWSR
jgi:orotate phosphoribosyltransferase